jgi:lipopolysaccharide export system permease protein
MRILDNYISASIVRIFISTICVFCFLYILIDLATHLEDFISNKVPHDVVISYYASFFPLIFVQTAPIACLLSALFTYSSLNNSNEIIALRASGLNFWKITRPAIIFGIMIAALVFCVNEKFVPQSIALNQDIKKDKIELSAEKRSARVQPINYLFFYGLNNKLFFIDKYEPALKSMDGLTIIAQDDHQRMTEKIVALKAVWTGSAWKALQCQVSTYTPGIEDSTGEVQFFKEKTLDFREKPEDLLKQRNSVAAMNIRELKEYIRRFKGSGAVAALNGLKVDLHQKIAYPFACIVIIFAGLPFALTTGRRKGLTFASIGIAMIMGFLFFVVNAMGLALGKSGALPPIAAAWLAPVLFIIAGIYAARKLF